MCFPEMLPSDEQRESYARICDQFSDFFQECSRCLAVAWDIVHAAAAKTGQEYHSSILALARHVIESVDGISIQVSKGGSYSCQPLLRSALEATLGVMYILEKDTERRALAYSVTHAHKRIKVYNRLDPSTQAGQQFRTLLKNDPFKEFFNRLPAIDFPKRIANLQSMLARTEYQPIEAEWQRMKSAHPRKEDPAWYSLFGGPKNVRELAIHLNWAGLYEILYRIWSDEVHAGNALESIGAMGGEAVWRPIRHPELLQSVVQHGTAFALWLAQRLIEGYAPERWPELKARYAEKIDSRAEELGRGQIIHAPWKDTSL